MNETIHFLTHLRSKIEYLISRKIVEQTTAQTQARCSSSGGHFKLSGFANLRTASTKCLLNKTPSGAALPDNKNRHKQAVAARHCVRLNRWYGRSAQVLTEVLSAKCEK